MSELSRLGSQTAKSLKQQPTSWLHCTGHLFWAGTENYYSTQWILREYQPISLTLHVCLTVHLDRHFSVYLCQPLSLYINLCTVLFGQNRKMVTFELRLESFLLPGELLLHFSCEKGFKYFHLQYLASWSSRCNGNLIYRLTRWHFGLSRSNIHSNALQ